MCSLTRSHSSSGIVGALILRDEVATARFRAAIRLTPRDGGDVRELADGLTAPSPPMTAGSTSIGVCELDLQASILVVKFGDVANSRWKGEGKTEIEIERGLDSW